MGATYEERIGWLFQNRGPCLKEMAIIFADRPREWLTLEDIINLIGRTYPNSTICSNFNTLSLTMKEIGNHSYIDTEVIKNGSIGRPARRGKLSDAAHNRIFKLVTPVKERPPSCRMGNVLLQPLPIGDSKEPNAWLSPEDIMELRKYKIGEKSAVRSLQVIASLPDNEMGWPTCTFFAKPFYDFRHYNRPGRRPSQPCVTDNGLVEWGSDVNRTFYSLVAPHFDFTGQDARGHALEEHVEKGEHDNESARSAAATALGNIDDPRAISPLEGMCKDLSGNVQAAAKNALGIPLRPSTYTDTIKKCDDEEEYLALKNVHARIGQLIIHQNKGDMFCFGATLRGHHGFPQLLRQLENGNYIKKR